MSLNSSLYTSYSGVLTNQTALTVTSNNMANANTRGYSRQRITTSGIYASTTYNTYNTGSGVEIQNIESISNQHIRQSSRSANGGLGYYDTQQNYLYEMEISYGDPYGQTPQTAADDFMNSWEELSKDPSDQAARGMVYETGNSFCDSVTDYNNQIDEIEASAVKEVEDTVSTINTITTELAAINKAILSYPKGQVPLELVDKQELLLDDLSMLTDCTAVYQPNGTVDVVSGNGMLVHGSDSEHLVVEKKSPNGFPAIEWENGNSYSGAGGSLGGLMDLLDPENSPNFEETRTEFNNGVMDMVNEINAMHRTGTGLNGSTGLDFFVPINPDLPLSPENMQVNPALEDVNNIAASASGELGDGDIAYAISELQNEKIVNSDGTEMTMNEFFAEFTQTLGTQTEVAVFMTNSQTELYMQLQTNLNSVSMVSTDEEMANMMVYQQAYNASINVMNTVDELLEHLINELG